MGPKEIYHSLPMCFIINQSITNLQKFTNRTKFRLIRNQNKLYSYFVEGVLTAMPLRLITVWLVILLL